MICTGYCSLPLGALSDGTAAVTIGAWLWRLHLDIGLWLAARKRARDPPRFTRGNPATRCPSEQPRLPDVRTTDAVSSPARRLATLPRSPERQGLDELRVAQHTAASDVASRFPSFRSSRRYLRRTRNAVALSTSAIRVTAPNLGGYVDDCGGHPKG